MKKERGLSRMDYGGTHGWWVRLYRTDDAGDRVCTSKLFSDGVHGGKRKARLVAVKWRDQTEKSLAPRKHGGALGVVPVGHGYVRRAKRVQRKSVSDCFVAWLRGRGGKARMTSRSVAVWGVRGAKAECEKWLARECRELKKDSARRTRVGSPTTRRGAT